MGVLPTGSADLQLRRDLLRAQTSTAPDSEIFTHPPRQRRKKSPHMHDPKFAQDLAQIIYRASAVPAGGTWSQVMKALARIH